MSIIRVGLAETEKFAEGWEAIFGKKEQPQEKQAQENKAGTETEAKKEQPKQS